MVHMAIDWYLKVLFGTIFETFGILWVLIITLKIQLVLII